jgi:hypothetical protein
MGDTLLWQVGQVFGSLRAKGFDLKVCNQCGVSVIWWRNKPYETQTKIDYYEGCEGIVYDRNRKELRLASTLFPLPKQVTPKHRCTKWDAVLKTTHEKVFEKQIDTLF